ncbi:hypothetical protein HMSSN036_72290 [Paenibacillus macerans]|nr:hypothetical protein HMSSN036_72290 [Paenibacillus macerans]
MNRKISMLLMMVFLVVILAACGSNQGGSAAGNGWQCGLRDECRSQRGEYEYRRTGERRCNWVGGGGTVDQTSAGGSQSQENPGNVVVFDYGVLETLDKLGVEAAAVPQGNLPAHLKNTKTPNTRTPARCSSRISRS